MYHVELDIPRNFLKITYGQRVIAEDARRCAEEISSLIPQLKPSFRLLADMTSMELMETDCIPYIRQTMDLCNSKGIGLVIRVLPDPHKDVGLNILSLFHYRRDLRIVTCENLEKALEVMAVAG